MHLSQPAISRLIADLERSVGFRLFERVKGSPLRATPEAESFHQEVERSFLGIQGLTRIANDIRNARSGNLRIACLPALATGFLPEVIRDFLSIYPGVRINLQSRASTTVRQWVAAQQFDLGFATPSDHTPGLRTELFLSLTGVCVLPPQHRLRRKDVITPEDLRGDAFISLALEDPTRGKIDRIFDDARVERDLRIETQYAMTIGGFVMRGVGCSILNPLSARELIPHGVIVKPFMPEVRFEYILCTPEHRLPSRIATSFIESLRAAKTRLLESETPTATPSSKSPGSATAGRAPKKRPTEPASKSPR
ncbi:LysR family transcriptional regulator [Steroidobacter sp.]|uniref:LysR family transcriptional regulator n=1 Tax=Steroidobacter sp. TaxID=1978227 RepID=UPI002AC3617F|nr:LysR family transcriptional regulator [Steroidobacter sp.]